MQLSSHLTNLGIKPVPAPPLLAAALDQDGAEPTVTIAQLAEVSRWADTQSVCLLEQELLSRYQARHPITLTWEIESRLDDDGETMSVVSVEITGEAAGWNIYLPLDSYPELGAEDPRTIAALMVALGVIEVDTSAPEDSQYQQARATYNAMIEGDDEAVRALSMWLDHALTYARLVRRLCGELPTPMLLEPNASAPGAN